MLVGMLALPLNASSIDASGDTDIVLHTGDELIFQLNIQDYQSEAPIYGAPALPSSLGFTLVTDPTVSSATFAAGIESVSGSDTKALGGALGFQQGIFESAYYTGPVSMLSGSFGLSDGDAASLFADGAALLYLEDLGGRSGYPRTCCRETCMPTRAEGRSAWGHTRIRRWW
jgi:hypothetical protein